MAIRWVEILTVASQLAKHLGLPNFMASDGWLWCFRKRQGLFNVKIHMAGCEFYTFTSLYLL